MGKREDGKIEQPKQKIIYQATYRDIYWEENDKMRDEVDRMWNSLNREQKRKLKKFHKNNKKII